MKNPFKPNKYEIAEADLLELHEAFMRFHESVQSYLAEVHKQLWITNYYETSTEKITESAG